VQRRDADRSYLAIEIRSIVAASGGVLGGRNMMFDRIRCRPHVLRIGNAHEARIARADIIHLDFRMTFLRLVLVLALELEVASYMTLNDVGRNATVVPEELVGQSGTGKVGLRLGKDRLLGSSVHGYGQRAARERDLDRAWVAKVNSPVDAD